MNLPELQEVVYRFHTRGPFTTTGYDETPEFRRRMDATLCARSEYPKWKAMVRRLGTRYKVWDLSVHLLSVRAATAHTLIVWIPGKEAEVDPLRTASGLSCKVSILGPYYVVCHRDIPGAEPVAQDVAREIEATYGGYQPIPPELGNVVVPDIALDTVASGEATIYDCLLETCWMT
jgi:hypothetical protein